MKLNPRAAQDKRIREAFDFLYYVCRNELNPSEFEYVKSLRQCFFKRGSLAEAEEHNLFTLADQYKNSENCRNIQDNGTIQERTIRQSGG